MATKPYPLEIRASTEICDKEMDTTAVMRMNSLALKSQNAVLKDPGEILLNKQGFKQNYGVMSLMPPPPRMSRNGDEQSLVL